MLHWPNRSFFFFSSSRTIEDRIEFIKLSLIILVDEDGHRTYPDWITEASGIIWSFNVPQNEPCLSEAEINQTESTMSARTSNPMEPTLSSLEPISPVFDPASPVTDTPWEAQNTGITEFYI